jgi:hypothetical protein
VSRPVTWWRAAPTLVAAAVSIAYLIAAPRTVDLAAAVFRARLFDHAGFTIWNSQWYGGHYTLAYSVLFPPLAWVFGPLLLGAISSVAAAALFEPLARAHFGERARWGALWFGLAATTSLVSGRIPFALGVALGLGALLALQRGRPVLAAALALLCALASPVAGAFLALAALAYALTARGPRRAAIALIAAALAPPLLLTIAFPNGGHEPFDFSSFLPVPLVALASIYVLPRGERALRVGFALYALAAIAAVLVETPMGGNVVRLGTVAAGPLLACALVTGESRPRLALTERRRLVVVAAVVLAGAAVWQWSPAVRDVRKAYESPATRASYYRPLLGFLARADADRSRIEIPFTRSHWEAAEVAPHFPLARGWERQTDIARNPIFYGGVLNRLTYAAWLTENAVRFVALADTRPDYSSYGERGLIESGLPYLRLVWRSRHWRVYAVTLPHPMVVPATGTQVALIRVETDRVSLDVKRPGSATVRVRWSPYWRASGACVQRAGDWTRLDARRPGPLELRISFTLGRVLSGGRRCG